MARIRSIKPELRTSITVSMWPREVRYFFVLMLGYLDDYGRGVDDELLIASDCFPRDRDITPERVDSWLEMIADSGPLCRYEVDSRQYLHAPNWREHQRPSHPTRSKVPPCPDDEPDDFKRWRGSNPQRLRNRSRKSREGFEKFPEGLSGTSGAPSGVAPQASSGASPRVVDTPDIEESSEGSWGDETADQHGYEGISESLANSSGNSPEHFVHEQGSKGARERGSEGARGCGGEGLQRALASVANAPQRPDGLHLIPSDFHLNDTMRRYVAATYPGLDPDFETDQFVRYWRSEGRRKRNWHDAWQKWLADSAKRAYDRRQRSGSSNVTQLPGRPRRGGALGVLPTAEEINNTPDEKVL